MVCVCVYLLQCQYNKKPFSCTCRSISRGGIEEQNHELEDRIYSPPLPAHGFSAKEGCISFWLWPWAMRGLICASIQEESLKSIDTSIHHPSEAWRILIEAHWLDFHWKTSLWPDSAPKSCSLRIECILFFGFSCIWWLKESLLLKIWKGISC